MRASELAAILAENQERTLGYESRLADVVEAELAKEGKRAARAFRSKASQSSRPLTAAAGVSNEAAMIAVYPSIDQAVALSIYTGEAPETLHITLAYLGEVEQAVAVDAYAALADIAARFAPLVGEIGGVGSFADHGDGYPSIALPDVPGLPELRQAVTEALAAAGIPYAGNHGWTPHITLAYTEELAPPPGEILGMEVDFDGLYVTRGDNPRRLPLGETTLVAAGGPPDWTPPHPDELFDASSFIERLRTKSDPVRRAAIAELGKGLPIDWDVTNPLVGNVLSRSASKVTRISETTRLSLLRVMRESYEQGLTIPDTAKAIEAAMLRAAPGRARMIARTELSSIANGGAVAAADTVGKAAGVSYWKTWMTAAGAEHPRHEAYLGLNGQVVRMNDLFTVGSSRLAYPGDPSGPAHDVIMCRCSVSFVENPSQVVAPPVEEPPQALPLGDNVSVPTGDLVPADIVKFVQERGLLGWPPEKGATARSIFGNRRDTEELFKAGGQWTEERARLHDEIVAAHFRDKEIAAEKHAFFTSGGGASGKSKAPFRIGGRDVAVNELDARSDIIYVDPDRIKAMLPEYQKMKKSGDAYAASGVHEESSEIARRVAKMAQERGYSYVLDSTGSSSSFLSKIEEAASLGYQTEVSMFSIPTNEAIVRAVARGRRSGRFVSVHILREAHRGASKALSSWKDAASVDRWRVYDNSGVDPLLVAEKRDGVVRVYDELKWRQILAKSEEGTPPPKTPEERLGEAARATKPPELPTISPRLAVENLTANLDPTKKVADAALDSIGTRLAVPAREGVAKLSIEGAPRVGNQEVDGYFSPKDYSIHVRRLGAPYETTVHEFGHFVDWALVGGNPAGGKLGLYGTQRADRVGLGAWEEAVAASPAYQRALAALEASVSAKTAVVRIEGEKFVRAEVEYALDGRELWARSFVQWISLRDENLAQRVREMRGNPRFGLRAWYWSDSEFEPIARAMDDFFRARGWLVGER